MTITRRRLAAFCSTLAILLLAVASALVGVRSAHAASFTVTNCAAETGPGTIGQSVTDATADPGTSETITFSCGSGSHTIPITVPLTITMPGKTLLIDGGGTIALDGGTTSQIMQITVSAGTTLANLALNRGNAPNGGALSVASSPLTLTNDTFGQDVALSAGGAGGAVDDTGPGTLTISGSTFAGNTSGDTSGSNDGPGGAIHVGPGVTGGSITNSVFSQNTVRGITFAHGGAIENDGILDAISSDTFTDNNASCAIDCRGGAIYNRGTITTVSDNTFTHNSVTENGQSPAVVTGSAPLADTSPARGYSQQTRARGLSGAATLIPQVSAFYAFGGAIDSAGTITTLTTTTFTRNSVTASDAFGGAIDFDAEASATSISMSTFSGNVAKAVTTSFPVVAGGAIDASGGQLTITNSTFTGNSAVNTGTQPAYGGAIDVTSATTVNLVYDTLSGDSISATNSASAGGEVYNAGVTGHLTINGSILSGGSNTSTSTATNCGGTNPTNVGYNLDSGTTCAFSSANHSLSNTDPLLGPLASNGGPTQTLALLPESPAIDAGGTSANGCPSTDQRGVTRPQGAACDIGAYEYVPIATTTTLSATPSVQTQGQPVQLCATVAGVSGTGTPRGTVTFFDGSVSLGSAPLNSGAACLSITTLALGSHSVTAHYGGDPSYLASTSSPQTVTIGVVGQSGTNAPAGAQGSQTGPNGGPTGGPVASAPNNPSNNGNSQSPAGSAPIHQATTRAPGGNPLLIVLLVLLGLLAASGGAFLLYRRRILTR